MHLMHLKKINNFSFTLEVFFENHGPTQFVSPVDHFSVHFLVYEILAPCTKLKNTHKRSRLLRGHLDYL